MFWIHPRYRAQLEAASAGDYDAITSLEPADHYVEKQGRSTGRYELRPAGGSLGFYLKKYQRMAWWQRWLTPIESFPGPRELANLRRAEGLGIRVTEPVVAGADRQHACKSMLAVRELSGYTPLHEFIPSRWRGDDDAATRALRRSLADRIADVARRLHAAHLYHCDFYLCHFFIRESSDEPAGFDLVLIDLMRLKESRWSRWQVKDLAQLLYSSALPPITRTDRLRFFKRYLGIRRLDAAAKRLVRRIEWKAWFYRRHNAAA
jgi:heptose I phosphotransferase